MCYKHTMKNYATIREDDIRCFATIWTVGILFKGNIKRVKFQLVCLQKEKYKSKRSQQSQKMTNSGSQN